jgi:hypothetical protein
MQQSFFEMKMRNAYKIWIVVFPRRQQILSAVKSGRDHRGDLGVDGGQY